MFGCPKEIWYWNPKLTWDTLKVDFSNRMQASDGFSGHDIAGGQGPQAINMYSRSSFHRQREICQSYSKKTKIKPCQPRLDIIFRSYAQIFRKFSEVFAASPSTPSEIRGAAPWLTRMDDADGLSN
jgi:hypothetical protein